MKVGKYKCHKTAGVHHSRISLPPRAFTPPPCTHCRNASPNPGHPPTIPKPCPPSTHPHGHVFPIQQSISGPTSKTRGNCRLLGPPHSHLSLVYAREILPSASHTRDMYRVYHDPPQGEATRGSRLSWIPCMYIKLGYESWQEPTSRFEPSATRVAGYIQVHTWRVERRQNGYPRRARVLLRCREPRAGSAAGPRHRYTRVHIRRRGPGFEGDRELCCWVVWAGLGVYSDKVE